MKSETFWGLRPRWESNQTAVSIFASVTSVFTVTSCQDICKVSLPITWTHSTVRDRQSTEIIIYCSALKFINASIYISGIIISIFGLADNNICYRCNPQAIHMDKYSDRKPPPITFTDSEAELCCWSPKISQEIRPWIFNKIDLSSLTRNKYMALTGHFIHNSGHWFHCQ